MPQLRGVRGRWLGRSPGQPIAHRALLLAYYTDDGRLHYAGRTGTGMTAKELKRLAQVLAPLQATRMPLAAAAVAGALGTAGSRHTYPTWTEDNLLRQVCYQGSGRTSQPGRWCGLFPIRLGASAKGQW